VGLLGSLDSGSDRVPNLSPLYFGNLVLKGITSGSRRMLEDLLAACEANSVRPHIDRRFAFAEARAALDHLAGAEHVGKVVITDFG
jgi:NADPH:quinone reductase-like Zn-dependent oxidoreductase